MTQDIGRFMFAVGAVIERPDTGEILLLRRAPSVGYLPGQWGMVYGRKGPGETVEQALRREIEEETGLTDLNIQKALGLRHFYHGGTGPDHESFVLVFWVRARTQDIHLNHEHTDFQWIKPENAPGLIENDGIRWDLEMYLSDPETFRLGLADLTGKVRIY